MKESVRQTKHPWLVGIVIAGIAVGYFFLLGSAEYPEPGPNVRYDVESYAALDRIETRFEETSQIDPGVPNPRAMAVYGDKLYVAGDNAVVVFDAEDQEIARHAIDGTPNSLTVDSDGAVFLGMRDHVQVLNADGTLQATWQPVSDRSYFTSIAVQDENVFVADAGNRVVLRFDRDGNLQTRIGEMDADRDVPGIEVPSPYLDLAVNDEGHLWVVNPGKLGLERYRDNGDIVTSWYRPWLELDGFSGCCNPTQIAFNQNGLLVTAEKGLVRLKIYDVTSGEFEELIAGSRLFPKEQSLRDLAVDARDRILVLDPRSDTIRIFESKEESDGTSSQQV